jgi:hypothetical protein
MDNQNVLYVLEEKLITHIDYNFVTNLGLPYNNAYYTVCFVEVLNEFINKEKEFSSVDDALNSINSLATILYNEINISSVLTLALRSY